MRPESIRRAYHAIREITDPWNNSKLRRINSGSFPFSLTSYHRFWQFLSFDTIKHDSTLMNAALSVVNGRPSVDRMKRPLVTRLANDTPVTVC